MTETTNDTTNDTTSDGAAAASARPKAKRRTKRKAKRKDRREARSERRAHRVGIVSSILGTAARIVGRALSDLESTRAAAIGDAMQIVGGAAIGLPIEALAEVPARRLGVSPEDITRTIGIASTVIDSAMLRARQREDAAEDRPCEGCEDHPCPECDR